MADRLERSEMLRRRAASDIAHDLATPATVLESQLQAMIDGVVPTDRDGPGGRPLGRDGARRRRGADIERPRAAPRRRRSRRSRRRSTSAAAIRDIALGPRRPPARARRSRLDVGGRRRAGGPGRTRPSRAGPPQRDGQCDRATARRAVASSWPPAAAASQRNRRRRPRRPTRARGSRPTDVAARLRAVLSGRYRPRRRIR